MAAAGGFKISQTGICTNADGKKTTESKMPKVAEAANEAAGKGKGRECARRRMSG